jgi:hypothetical protein
MNPRKTEMEAWVEAYQNAQAHWQVIADDRLQVLDETPIRYVSAEARTGSRYSVTVTPLPIDGRRYEGGPLLVTVTSPWTDSWTLQRTGSLHVDYVAEHLTGRRAIENALHGGDLAALTLTVAYALDREALL